MKKSLFIVTILMAVLIALGMAATLATTAEEGKDLFVKSKCGSCHDVSSAGIEAKISSVKMKGPDLKGVTDRHDQAWLVKFIKKEEEIDGKKHKGSFKGSDEELAAILDWLGEQK